MVGGKLGKKKQKNASELQVVDSESAQADMPSKKAAVKAPKKKPRTIDDVARAMDLSKTKNWYNDRYQAVVVQRNVLFFVTILALGGLILSVFAVAALNNRKTFEPFVIEVEDKTGIVTQVSTSSLAEYQADEILLRYFLVQYIQARESYAEADFSRYFDLVRLMSSRGVYAGYLPQVSASNEDSPYHLGKNATWDVAIKSISVLNPVEKQLQIRIKQTQFPAGSDRPDWEKHYIITLKYDYLDVDFSEAERLKNPLGFTILSYRKDRDSGEEDDAKYAK